MNRKHFQQVLVAIVFILLVKGSVWAERITLHCEVTPALEPDHLTMHPIKPSNNLWHKQGSAYMTRGDRIIVTGELLDKDCVPISHATIEVWQADSMGKYIEFYDTTSKWDKRKPGFDPEFGYTGTATTDNKGRFSFFTIYPASEDKRAPRLHVRITHPHFKELQSKIFFKQDPKNQDDEDLRKLAKEALEERVMARVGHKKNHYHITLTLDGVNRYRRY